MLWNYGFTRERKQLLHVVMITTYKKFKRMSLLFITVLMNQMTLRQKISLKIQKAAHLMFMCEVNFIIHLQFH